MESKSEQVKTGRQGGGGRKFNHPRHQNHHENNKQGALRYQRTIKAEKPPPEKIAKWRTGKSAKGFAKTKFHSKKMRAREEELEEIAQSAARTEFLYTEDSGALEGSETNMITQWDIKSTGDEATQQKIFDLQLKEFGPYRIDYTRNGRHLLIGGQKGHIASFDWQAKKLHCEINVMESVSDVKWLHQETMFAVAQRKWTYIYDNQGIELHCLKHLELVQKLEFLPYHFLLVSSNAKGYLSYLDVSIGKEVSGIHTRQGRLDVMAVNPQTAVIHLGHPNGTVSMWIPSMKEPAAKMLCHHSGIRDISIDASGNYMASTGMDRRLKIFDIRMLRELSQFQYQQRFCPGLVDFSQKGLLAVSRDEVVEVYKDMTLVSQKPDKPYMYHRNSHLVHDIAFCPFEDAFGLGHSAGFSSIVIPGAGEPNFDAFEANPFQTKSQRKETEVRLLLDKVHPDMISFDNTIGKVDTQTAIELQKEREKNKYLKPDRVDYTPRVKKKGASTGVKMIQRKKGVQEERLRKGVQQIIHTKQKEGRLSAQNKHRENMSALDRLKRKDD